MDNMNFDANTLNKLKDMMDKGQLNDVISQIPPDMIQNFSSMMNKQNGTNSSTQTKFQTQNYAKTGPKAQNQTQNQTQTQTNEYANNFDFSQIDMNTIMKMKSVMEKLNNSNDPRSNLLYSLKPYLREEKKEKLDQYANLLNVAKIADILKDTDKESPK